MSIPASFMNSMISDQLNSQTREFFRPKSTGERLQLIFSITWLLLAFLGSELQAVVFFIVIGLIVFNRLNLLQEEVRPFLSDILRFSFYFFLFIWLRPGTEQTITLFEISIDNIILIQKSILAGLIVLGVFLRNVRLQLLKPTKTNMLTNYLDFVFQTIKGLSSAIFLYILFELLNWLPAIAQSTDKFINIQDLLLILASFAVLISSQSPEGSAMRKLMVSELFLASETRFERIRDSLFKISLIILFYINIVPIFSSGHTLISKTEWSEAATLIFVIALITFMIALFDNNPRNTNLGQFQDYFTGKSESVFPEKFKNIRDSIQDATINPETTQYFKLNEDLPIINKEKTKFIAKKNSVAIPIKETPDGVAVVFVGENELINNEPNSADKMPTVEKIDESATAIIIPNDIWQSTYEKLEALKPTDETISHLALKGIDTKEKLITLAEGALNDFKLMTLPQNITNRVQGMVEEFQKGKYFVSETKKGTHIRLPGITVIENQGYTFVRVLGLKVLDAKGSTVVSAPFLKVIDTPEYDFVTLPGLKVIDAGGSSLVNIAGFQITEGDQSQIESALKKISSDSLQLTSAFDKLDNQLNKILESPDQLLLTKTASGKQLELISGSNSDRALISGDFLPESFKKSHREIEKENRKKSKKETRRKAKKERRRVKSGLNLNLDLDLGISPLDLDLGISPRVDSNKQHKNKPDLTSNSSNKLLNKFYKIVKISHSDLDLERLARQLEFSSDDELENWLINLNLDSIQINWDDNKLILSDQLKEEIKSLATSE